MKKFISIIIAIALCISTLTFGALATNTDADLEGIASALQTIDCVKEIYGLSHVNFDQVKYADSIFAYELTGDGLAFCLEFVPIIYNGSLIGWVTKNNVGVETLYQFTTDFVVEVNEIISDNMEFAFIYDYNASYLYDGCGLYKLNDITMKIENPVALSEVDALSQYDIVLGDFSNSYELPTSMVNANSRAPVYYVCDIDYVSQNPPSNLCWAASAACIINFLQNANYSATAIAKIWYGSHIESDYNRLLEIGLQDNVLSEFGVFYTYKFEAPSGGVILRNVTNDYPIMATFCYTYGYHDSVIYGINVGTNQIYIMDPQNGFIAATYTSTHGFAYTFPGSGLTSFLDGAACKYWTAS
jgi:hypothetical protein